MKNVQAYKTIGEVEKILKVKPHVLRFWEESFSQVKPLKRKGGRRLYSEDVINILRIIKKLVSDEGYSIRGVKKYLSKNKISDIKKEGAMDKQSTITNKNNIVLAKYEDNCIALGLIKDRSFHPKKLLIS